MSFRSVHSSCIFRWFKQLPSSIHWVLPIFLFIGLIEVGLFTPQPIQAHPNLGITPTATATTPPTPSPTVTPTPNPSGDDDDDDDQDPPEIIDVAVECNLTCGADNVGLAVSFPIQLIHIGSGWIAETTVSNSGATRVQVPYAGEWQVFMTGPPQFNQPVPTEFPNSFPLLLGTVKANSGVQIVDCPISCTEVTVPDVLPATGGDNPIDNTTSPLTIFSGLILITLLANSLAKTLVNKA